MKLRQVIAAAFLAVAAPLSAATIESVNVLEFGPENVLFAADSQTGIIHALDITVGENKAKGNGYNLDNLDKAVADLLGSKASDIRINDLAIHPESNEAYLAVARVSGDSYQPAIVVINQAGEAQLLDLKSEHPELKINTAPAEDFTFYEGKYSGRRLSFTDLNFHKDKLYVAGLSNADFASTLWTSGYPFDGKNATTTVEIYHDIHNQQETRAPIRAMAITEVDGEDYMLAAYTCTPLVAIKLDELKDGAHINGKTIAELGYGNTPIDLNIIEEPDMQGNKHPMLFVANKNQMAQAIPMGKIAEAIKGEGLKYDQNIFKRRILGGRDIPMTGLVQVDSLDGNRMVTVRRDLENGDLELMSFMKGMYMRISDFQSEYEIPGYEYSKDQDMMKGIQNMMKMDEGYSKLVAK